MKPFGSLLLVALMAIPALFCPSGCRSISAAESAVDDPTQERLSATGTMTLMQKKLALGIDFIAVGNEPFWSLDIDQEKVMRFKSLTQPSAMKTPPARVDKAQDADVTRYYAQTEAGTMIATVSRVACADSMSDETFPFGVRVEIKRTQDSDYTIFQGCGRYVVDLRINDVWVLTHFGDRVLKPEDFTKGLPVVEFQLDDHRVVGHTGCNRISGWFEPRGSRIVVGHLATTRMACPDMAFENEFLAAMSRKTLQATLDDGQLTLTDDDGMVLKFAKTD